MTAEQYQQVISIDNRINQLEKVQEEITGECINIWRKDKKLVIFKEVEK